MGTPALDPEELRERAVMMQASVRRAARACNVLRTQVAQLIDEIDKVTDTPTAEEAHDGRDNDSED